MSGLGAEQNVFEGYTLYTPVLHEYSTLKSEATLRLTHAVCNDVSANQQKTMIALKATPATKMCANTEISRENEELC